MRFGQALGLIATAAVALLLWSLRHVVIQLFAAVVLAMALCTIVGVVRDRLRCSRPMALLVSLSGLVVLVAVALAAVVPPFVEQFQQLLLQLPMAASRAAMLLRDLRARLRRTKVLKKAMEQASSTRYPVSHAPLLWNRKPSFPRPNVQRTMLERLPCSLDRIDLLSKV